MVRFAFKRGLVFLQQNKAYQLVKRLANGKLQFEDKSGHTEALTEAEIHAKWESGEWQIEEESLSAAANVFYATTPRDLASMDSEAQERAKQCHSYIAGIRARFEKQGQRLVSTPNRLRPMIAMVAAELRDSHPPSPATIFRWWKKFAPTGCLTKFISDRSRSGRPVDLVQRSLFDEAVAEVYLTKQKLAAKDVVERLAEKVDRVNKGLMAGEEKLRQPSTATVYRWVKTLYQPVVLAAREGKAFSEREFRSVTSGLKVHKILERIELDHTPLDILVICKLTKMPLGRPWITIAVDRYSRMVVGFYISFHPPSATSVLQCIRQAIFPKELILKRFPSISGPWPARGIPVSCAIDNGMDLHARDFETVALELGIGLHYLGAGHPELKGAIERLIGTLNRDLMHKLPGTTFSNPKQRGDYDSEEQSAIDLEVLTEIVSKWIVDVYHKRPHRGLHGKTPLQVWQEGERNRVIELPAFPRQFDLIVSASATRSLFHYGVEYDNLRYNSPLLQEIRRRSGGVPKVAMRAFEHSVAQISVLDPTLNEYIDVPAVEIGYAQGLGRHVHRLVCAEARKRFGDKWAMEELRATRREIQAIVDAAIKDKKMAARKSAAVAVAADSQSIIHQFLSPEALEAAMEPTVLTSQESIHYDDGGVELPEFESVEINPVDEATV